MATLRHAPGERVPIAGTYALVGHYGEVTGFAERFEVGDQFPLAVASPEFGPLWYVRVDEPLSATKAA